MQQIVEKIREKRTPVAINELINGKEIIIKRDNANDDLHVGKEVALKIFHRDEIAGGQSPVPDRATAGVPLEVEAGPRPRV